MLHMKLCSWWWKSVFHVSLCLFCSYFFHVFSIFLWIIKCWYHAMLFVEIRNMRNFWYDKEKSLCVMSHAICLLSQVMSKGWKNKWRLCMSLTWEWKKKRTMRSNRRGIWGSWNLPPWLSTSCWFLLLLLKYEVFKPSLYVMLNLGILAKMRGGYVQFSPRMCRKL